MLPNIGPYTKVLSKFDPNGSSGLKIGLFCLVFVIFSPPM